MILHTGTVSRTVSLGVHRDCITDTKQTTECFLNLSFHRQLRIKQTNKNLEQFENIEGVYQVLAAIDIDWTNQGERLLGIVCDAIMFLDLSL